MITGAGITALVALLGTLGSGIGWWLHRRDAKSNPLPRHAAEVALSKEALGIVQASAAALEQDVKRLRDDREADRRRIDALEADVQSLRATWSRWYSDLRDRWHYHREQPTPPEPPTIH